MIDGCVGGGRFPCCLKVLVSPFLGESLSCCLSNKKVTKEKGHPTSGPTLCSGFPRSGAAPGAGLQGPSMAL